MLHLKTLAKTPSIDPLVREYVASTVGQALRRMAAQLNSTTVTLTDINGPRGGVGKRCRITVNFRGAGETAVEATAVDWRLAIDQATRRAERTAHDWLRRRITRKTQQARRRRELVRQRGPAAFAPASLQGAVA